MGFDVTISKLQHIQHIDDIPSRGELVYNTIVCFIIDTLALAIFFACFFGGAILKRNNHSINKEKTQFIYLSSNATCKIKWSCY
jgi:hypothetical protein